MGSSSNEPSEDGLAKHIEEDEDALLSTEEDAISGPEILMSMATLGPGPVAVKTEHGEEGLNSESAELRNGLMKRGNENERGRRRTSERIPARRHQRQHRVRRGGFGPKSPFPETNGRREAV